MIENTGLDTYDIERIQKVFSNFPQVEKVLLYGSRSIGNFRPSSDIDLTLIGNKLNSSILQEVEFELDDLLLPYKFDISIYDKIENPEFLNHIDNIGKVFYTKNINAQ